MRTIGTLFGGMLLSLSAAAFAVACVLWARSHAAPDVLACATDVPGHERRRAGVESHRGWVLLWEWKVAVLDLPGNPGGRRPPRLPAANPRLDVYPSGDAVPGAPTEFRRRLGFHTHVRMLPPTQNWAYRLSTRATAFPYWPVALLTGALPAAALARRLGRGGWRGAPRRIGWFAAQVAAGTAAWLLCAAVAGWAATVGGTPVGFTHDVYRPIGEAGGTYTGKLTAGFRGGRAVWFVDETIGDGWGEHSTPRASITLELSVGDAELKPGPGDRVRLDLLELSVRRADRSGPGTVKGFTTAVAIPGWAAVLLLAPVTVIPLIPLARARRREHRRRLGLCAACGYDLRASTGACPECGTPRPAVVQSDTTRHGHDFPA